MCVSKKKIPEIRFLVSVKKLLINIVSLVPARKVARKIYA